MYNNVFDKKGATQNMPIKKITEFSQQLDRGVRPYRYMEAIASNNQKVYLPPTKTNQSVH